MSAPRFAIWCVDQARFFRALWSLRPALFTREEAEARADAWNAWGDHEYEVVPWNEEAKRRHEAAEEKRCSR